MTTDTTRLKAAVDLREVAAMWTTLAKKTAAESEAPCPRCGGENRLTVRQHEWFCRVCAPAVKGGGRRDVLDFLQWVGAAHDFHGAVAWLESYTGQSAATAVPCSAAVAAAQAAVTRSVQHWSDPAWQAEMSGRVARAERYLVADGGMAGKLGREYLQRRGIDLATAQAWHVGVDMAYYQHAGAGSQAMAIMLPWLDGSSVLALEARFLAAPVRYWRQKARIGAGYYAGECVLAIGPRRRTDVLIIVEGYLNSLACWQAGYDAATFGSKESIGQPATMAAIRELASNYDALIVWADTPADAQRLQAELGGLAATSPHDCDAADLSRSGHLGGLLGWLTEQALQEKVRP